MEIFNMKGYFIGIGALTLAMTLLASFYTGAWDITGFKAKFRMIQVGPKQVDPKQGADPRLPPDCHLPSQWLLRTNSSNSSNSSKLWAVLHLEENDTCLEFLIKKHCYKDKRIVPNVVHYVMFGNMTFKIYTILSFLGTWKHIKPCFIVIHGDFPHGRLFEKFLTYKPRIIHIGKKPKQRIFGKKITLIEHKADVARLDIIYKYGGIYMDHDEIPLKSFDPLLNHSITLGQETGNQVGNGVIIAEPSALFIKIWMETYRSFNPSQWAVHSTVVPNKLVNLLWNMVFIVKTFFKPNYTQKDQLYDKNIDWSNFYGLHLYGKVRIQHDTLETIRYRDNTYGSVARFIYYGNKSLQKKEK